MIGGQETGKDTSFSAGVDQVGTYYVGVIADDYRHIVVSMVSRHLLKIAIILQLMMLFMVHHLEIFLKEQTTLIILFILVEMIFFTEMQV